MNLDAKIEAVLFFKAEPVSIKKLAAILKASEEKVAEGITVLEEKLADRGIKLISKDGEVMLSAAAEMGKLLEGLVKEELSRDIGKAGLETLSIVLYKGPVARSGIDYIRGVNSTFILRNLLVRGLVEKIQKPGDKRVYLYRPTFELLSYLGLSKVDDLPEFGKIKDDIEEFKRLEEGGDKGEGGHTDEYGGETSNVINEHEKE